MHIVLTLSLLTLNMHFPTGLSPEGRYPTDKYLLKVNNKNTSLVPECVQNQQKKLKNDHGYDGSLMMNFEQIQQIRLAFFMLILKIHLSIGHSYFPTYYRARNYLLHLSSDSKPDVISKLMVCPPFSLLSSMI